MPNSRRQARILAMQMLCQLDVQGEGALADLPDFLSEQNATPMVSQYAQELVRKTWADRSAIDDRIAKSATHWSVDRISPVERNIIRVAVAEMLGTPLTSPLTKGGKRGGIPAKVAIDEAVEIGKSYGGKDSPGFINGVLDAIYSEIKKATDDGTI